ncbi:hypothetical protein MK280_16435, partial [Myxococcota bacterium]|nr:hypothetical protein [Myxococcota bacterium]
QNVGVLFALVVMPMVSILLSGWRSTIWFSLVAIGLALTALLLTDEAYTESTIGDAGGLKRALIRDVVLLITAISMFAILIKWLQRSALRATESARLRAESSEKRARNLLQHQSITVQAAQELQTAEKPDVDSRTTEILRLVASLVDAEYASLTLWDPNYEKMHARYHWRAPDIKLMRTEWHSFSTLYGWSASQLKSNSFIAVDDIRELPFSAKPEQDLMNERGVKSWLSAVVRVDDWASGILSVQCHKIRHEWLPDEISSMQLMSGLLAGVVARQEAARTIQERDASFSKVFEAHPEG